MANDVEVIKWWPWSRIAQVKEELKRLGFRWTGDGWIGRVTDTAYALYLAGLLDLTQEELEAISKDAQIGNAALVSGQLSEDLRPYVISSYGDLHLISVEKFVRSGGRPDDLKTAVSGMKIYGDLDEILGNVLKMNTVEVWPTYAVLNMLDRGLAAELKSLTMSYNVVGKGGEKREFQIRLVKIIEGDKITVKFPVFMKNRIVDILRKHGYIVDEKKVEYKRVEFKPSLSLHEFQRAAVESWIKAGMRGTIAVATGGGKTFIAMDAMARASTSTLVLVVTKELAQQWINRIRRHLGISAGLLGDGEHDIRDVTVAIYNSAVKYMDELMGKFGLVVFDEAHHVPAETFKELALNLDSPYRLALSATPNREDGNEHLIFEAVGPLVFKASYDDMVEAGLVVPVEHYRVYVRMSDSEWRAYKEVRDESDDAIKLRNIAAQASAKIPTAVEIIAKEVEGGHRVLVFTQFIEQARAVYKGLKERGVPAALITSKEKDREVAFEKFASGAIKAVVTTTVLDEGVDVPDADVAVIVSGTGSERQMIQRVGRVVRKAPGKNVAKVYEIITAGTIEEQLSQKRHIRYAVEEIKCENIFH